MTTHSVVIAGAGPTGLMLAGELALAAVDVVIVERRTTQDVEGARALGLLSRTLELLDQRGIAERFIAAGQLYPAHGFSGIPLDVSDLPTRHNYVLGLWQSKSEPMLADWVVSELGVPIARGREVVGFAQDGEGVDVELSDGTSIRAQYLVGCDGGRSFVRRTAGIDFAGLDPTTSWMIADVEMDDAPETGMRRDSIGTHAIRRGDDGVVGLVLTEREVDDADEPTLEDLRGALVAVYGTDYGLRRAHWISRFTDMTRQAVAYRKGRVLLAGDAAHIHPPQGGQGMGTGMQDAVNLGWKLAQVVRGTSPDALLDTYHDERHPLGARVLQNTQVQVTIARGDERHQAVRRTMTELLGMDEPRRRIACELLALDIHYDFGEGHPLIGRRMPDLDVLTVDGATRVFALLHDAWPVLLNLGEPGGFDIGPWADRVRLVEATHDGSWELPVLGEVPAPRAVLIRPDGHVAWAGDLTDPDLPRALATWFGAP
ncbi:MAG: FAD-dependent monooxygenase [Acidimicrobiia bacterium]|nr:FAD-dependent monooxygenase [Acidimicrobiia bacterium]